MSDLSERNARRLLRFLTRNRKKLSPLLILTHNFPDPDALAAAFALQHLLSKGFKIDSRIAYGGIIWRMENRAMVSLLKIPVHKIRPQDFSRFAPVALVDTQPAFQNNAFPKDREATLVIDQHPPQVKPKGKLVILDPECGATCGIVARALLTAKIEIPARVATALAYGILSDTLHFYRAHRPDVVQTYLSLLPNCDMRLLARIQNPSRSKKFFATLAAGIRSARIRRRLIMAHLGFVASPDLVSQVADFLLTYRGIQWSFCTGRYKDRLYMSLRGSQPGGEAGEILRGIVARKEDAGGHDTIAGGNFRVGRGVSEEAWGEIESALTQKLLRRLRIPGKGEFHAPF